LPEALERDVGFLMTRRPASALRVTNRALEPLGLRARQYAVLQIASARQGSSQRQIGIDLGLDPSAVVSLVDDLERQALVVRTSDPTDRRARLVTATTEGRNILNDAAPRVVSAQAELMSDLTADEAGLLRELVSRVRLVAPAVLNS
jgi:DNA-binding MarR family transcriptional regulator